MWAALQSGGSGSAILGLEVEMASSRAQALRCCDGEAARAVQLAAMLCSLMAGQRDRGGSCCIAYAAGGIPSQGCHELFSPCGQRFRTVMAAVNFLRFEHEQRRLRGRRPLLLEECPVSASAMDALRAHLSGVAATADDVLLEGWTAHKVSRSPNAKKNENGSTKQDILYKSPSGMKFWGRAAVERFLLQAEERHWPRAKQPRPAVPAGAMGRETAEAGGHDPHEVLPSGLPVAASGIEIVPSDAVCEACGDGDDEAGNEILLCDGEGCEAAFHLQCLPVALTQVPLGDWFCPACAGPPPLSVDASVQAAATTVVEAVSVEVASFECGEGYLDVDVINVSCVAV